jgi:hypothetical protein
LRLPYQQYTALLRAADHEPLALEGQTMLAPLRPRLHRHHTPAFVMDYRTQLWLWNDAFTAQVGAPQLATTDDDDETPKRAFAPETSLLTLVFDPTGPLRRDSEPASWQIFAASLLSWFWRTTRKMQQHGWEHTTTDGTPLWMDQLFTHVRALPDTDTAFDAMWAAISSQVIPTSAELSYLLPAPVAGSQDYGELGPSLRLKTTQREMTLMREMPGTDARFSLCYLWEEDE